MAGAGGGDVVLHAVDVVLVGLHPHIKFIVDVSLVAHLH